MSQFNLERGKLLKALEWIGSSKKDLLSLPKQIRRTFGFGFYLAQIGLQHENAKVLKGFGGANVVEIIDMDESGTYRAVYTVKIKDAVFVLHIFQKKSKQGIKTPKADMDLIHSRLKQAEDYFKKGKK